MDITTLAAANAYTDKKVGAGGGASGGGGLPVVELTTEPTEEGAALTAEESATLNELVASGMPFVLKCTIGGYMVVSGVPSGIVAVDGSIKMYRVVTSVYDVMLTLSDGAWIAQLIVLD